MIAYRTILTVCFALFLSSCMATPVLTGKSADMSREIKQKAPVVGKVDISPDGRYVLSSGFESFILWDILQGEKMQTFTHQGFMTWPIAIAFSPDGKYFASGGKGTKLWDLATKQEIRTFDDSIGATVKFSPDGKHVIFSGPPASMMNPFSTKPPTMKIFDAATGGEIRNFKLQNIVQSVVYSPDGKYVLSGDSEGQVDLWDTSSGNSVRRVVAIESGFLNPPRNVCAVAFSSDGEYALSGGQDNSVILWNAKNLTQIKKLVGHTGMNGISSVAFSPDGKYILSAGYDSQVKIWELASGAEWKVLAGHTGLGASAKYSPNGKYVISAGDASTRIWDVSTGEEVASMIAFEDGEWIITTPNGYYSSSPKGDQYLSVKVRGKDYTIEQLRESFYRPDLVKVALSGGSLKELKNVADVKPPPVVAIVDTPKSIDKSDTAITLKITDAGGGIGDVRLYLNGSAVMLDSSRGVAIVPIQNTTDVYKKYTVKLTSGMNTIRAIAFNGDNSMQSTDALHTITASFKSITRPSLYALVIGINEYKNPKLQLNFAVSDAGLFADTLKKGAAPIFDKVVVRTLSTKEDTTRENIIKELKAMRSLNPDDLFVFYVASHGTVDDGEYYLITSNVGLTRTEKLRTDALSQSAIKELISNIPATKKLIVLDTCNAGALGEAIQVALLTRGMSEDTAMKILSRAVGSTILSASTSVQEALEGYQGHGLFTFVLAAGLEGKADKGKSGYVKTTELADYIGDEVPMLAEKIFKRAQYPTISISGQAFPIGKVR